MINDPLLRRYDVDVEFKNVVDMLHALMTQYRFAPSEIREALFVAQFKYAAENPHPYVTEDLKNTAQSVILNGISKRVLDE